MAGRVVYSNGDFVAEQDARVSIFDSALMFGDMAFEMTRTYGQRPFRLREHLDRLYASLRLLEIDCGISIEKMEQLTQATLEKNLPTESDDVDWQIMHDISRGPLSIYETAFPQGLQPTVLINCWPLITHMGGFAASYDQGVDLFIPAQLAIPAHLVDPKAKTRSRLHYQLAVLQGARAGERKWPLMMDPDGFLAEGPGWNVFLVKDQVLYTPEPRNILLGVSRRTVLDLAVELGIEVREANLGRYEALQADELFCSATTYGMVHAASFEGQQVADGRAGQVFNTILEAWKKLVGVDFIQQADDYAARLPAWRDAERSEMSSLVQEN
jgi:branched-chain amino acid aminotransferase